MRSRSGKIIPAFDSSSVNELAHATAAVCVRLRLSVLSDSPNRLPAVSRHTLCFVCAHLSADAERWAARDAEYASVAAQRLFHDDAPQASAAREQVAAALAAAPPSRSERIGAHGQSLLELLLPPAAPASPRDATPRALAHPDAHVPPEPSLARAYYEVT